tara:strand:+ start:3040 stop:3174 length:135 start_codon:yes stop_codon:yes gene_type:complete
MYEETDPDDIANPEMWENKVKNEEMDDWEAGFLQGYYKEEEEEE